MTAGAEQAATSSSNLVHAYMRFIADEETRQGREPQQGLKLYAASSLQGSSLRIGQACVTAQINPVQADHMLKETHTELMADLNYKHRPYGMARRLSNLTRLLLLRDDPTAVNAWLSQEYRTNVDAFYFYKDEMVVLSAADPESAAAGRAGTKFARESRTLRAQMLLGHNVLAPSLSLATLPHYNSYGPRKHQVEAAQFDITFLDGTPETSGSDPELFKLQVRAGCFGECDRTNHKRTVEERQSSFQEIRQKHNNDITFISVCCDIIRRPGARFGPVEQMAPRLIHRQLSHEPRRKFEMAAKVLAKHKIRRADRKGLLEPKL